MPTTNAERKQISGLRVGLDGEPLITVPEFLRVFRDGQSDRNLLVGELLGDALISQESDEVELALLAGFNLGFSEAHINLLASLAQAEWHFSHEDIVSALNEICSSGCVNALHSLARQVPKYLEFDDARALGTKAVWALYKVGDSTAKQALQAIAEDQDDLVGKLAYEKLLELS